MTSPGAYTVFRKAIFQIDEREFSIWIGMTINDNLPYFG